MKIPTILTRKKKLHAATARRSRALGLPDEMDYEEMAEPNMKLSRALLIVLVLHVVAVAGIVAFNTIKTRENLNPPPAEAVAASGTGASSAAATSASPNETPQPASVAPLATTKTAEPKSRVKDSGKTYTVARGDNPVTIARHFKV